MFAVPATFICFRKLKTIMSENTRAEHKNQINGIRKNQLLLNYQYARAIKWKKYTTDNLEAKEKDRAIGERVQSRLFGFIKHD